MHENKLFEKSKSFQYHRLPRRTRTASHTSSPMSSKRCTKLIAAHAMSELLVLVPQPVNITVLRANRAPITQAASDAVSCRRPWNRSDMCTCSIFPAASSSLTLPFLEPEPAAERLGDLRAPTRSDCSRFCCQSKWNAVLNKPA